MMIWYRFQWHSMEGKMPVSLVAVWHHYLASFPALLLGRVWTQQAPTVKWSVLFVECFPSLPQSKKEQPWKKLLSDFIKQRRFFLLLWIPFLIFGAGASLPFNPGKMWRNLSRVDILIRSSPPTLLKMGDMRVATLINLACMATF